jgi:hypothetical protein
MDINLFEKIIVTTAVTMTGSFVLGIINIWKRFSQFVSKTEIEDFKKIWHQEILDSIDDKILLVKQEVHSELSLIHYELNYIKEILDDNFETKPKK